MYSLNAPPGVCVRVCLWITCVTAGYSPVSKAGLTAPRLDLTGFITQTHEGSEVNLCFLGAGMSV